MGEAIPCPTCPDHCGLVADLESDRPWTTKPCPTCNGSGEVTVCPECKGRGWVRIATDPPCSRCGGTGTVPATAEAPA